MLDIVGSTPDLLLPAGPVLYLRPLNPTTDAGTYQCVAINDAGFGVATTVINFYIPPVIVDHPEDLRLQNGDTAVLQCRAESFPTSTYQWQRYDATANQFNNLPGEDNSTLQLIVSFSDHGVYRCVATASVINETAHSNNATLTGELNNIV